MGFNAAGDVFYTDNQGPWNGSSSLKWLRPGSFQGHPGGLKWDKDSGLPEKPIEPEDQTRMVKERERNPLLVPPAVMLPHSRVGNSPTAIVCDQTGGKFSPYRDQLFVSEQCFSNIARVDLEMVGGLYQGAVFPFLEGFGSGLIGMTLTPGGQLFTGGSDRGWGARGGKPWNLDRVVWNGQVPFEILTMKVQADGFVLTFTQPVDAASAGNPASYNMEAWTWAFRAEYGGPEVDKITPVIKTVTVDSSKNSVRLVIEGMRKGHVHHLRSPGVKSAAGLPLLHTDAYYTLNNLPQ